MLLNISGENNDARRLPSVDEAARFATLDVDMRVRTVHDAGHATTLGVTCDLAADMRARFPELGAAARENDAEEEDDDDPAVPRGMRRRRFPSVSPLDYYGRYVVPQESSS